MPAEEPEKKDLTIDEQIEFGWKVLDKAIGFSNHFDFKYAPILGTNAGALALLGSALKDHPELFKDFNSVSILSCLTFLGFLVSTIYVVLSNSPSYTSKDILLKLTGKSPQDPLPRSNIFFHDISRGESADAYREKLLLNNSKQELLRDLTDQIYEVSTIAARKGDRIRYATTALLISVFSACVTFLAILVSTQK